MDKYLKDFRFWIVVVVIILLIICCSLIMMGCRCNCVSSRYENMENTSDNAMYEIKFRSNWGTNKNEIKFPNNPHTGNFFIAVHNNNFKLFDLEDYASKGISNTSMYGTIDDLMNATSNNSNIKKIHTGRVLPLPGEKVFIIDLDKNNSYVSLVTMIAPSSDWFTGVSKLNLMKNSEWIKFMRIPIYVYDAGTDEGSGFLTTHSLKSNPDTISMLRSRIMFPDGNPKPIAFLEIRKL